MSMLSWIIYIGLVLIATSTPGPAVFFVISNSALHGKKTAFFAALGNITGLLCLGVISVTGLSAILTTSKIIFDIIKYLGAAYLIYLGLKMFFQKKASFEDLKSNLSNGLPAKIYFKAFGVAVSNPKAIIFIS